MTHRLRKLPIYLGDNDVMIVLIEKKNFEGLALPSGNEGGANEFWLPGGKLPKGYSEAVINQIPQANYTETLTNIK